MAAEEERTTGKLYIQLLSMYSNDKKHSNKNTKIRPENTKEHNTALEAKQMLALDGPRAGQIANVVAQNRREGLHRAVLPAFPPVLGEDDEITSSSVLSMTPVLGRCTLGGACVLAFTCMFPEGEDFDFKPRASILVGAVPPSCFPDVFASDLGRGLSIGENAALAAVATMINYDTSAVSATATRTAKMSFEMDGVARSTTVDIRWSFAMDGDGALAQRDPPANVNFS
nr:hypothetical protein Iba_chr05fCG9940 [Ipomoea batatas]